MDEFDELMRAYLMGKPLPGLSIPQQVQSSYQPVRDLQTASISQNATPGNPGDRANMAQAIKHYRKSIGYGK